MARSSTRRVPRVGRAVRRWTFLPSALSLTFRLTSRSFHVLRNEESRSYAMRIWRLPCCVSRPPQSRSMICKLLEGGNCRSVGQHPYIPAHSHMVSSPRRICTGYSAFFPQVVQSFLIKQSLHCLGEDHSGSPLFLCVGPPLLNLCLGRYLMSCLCCADDIAVDLTSAVGVC